MRLRQYAQGRVLAHTRSARRSGINIAHAKTVGVNIEVGAILRSEAERARIGCDAAQHEYKKILLELHHENLSAAEVDRLEQASCAEIAARQALWDALSRLDAFCRNGTVPEDLRILSERQADEPGCGACSAG